MDKHCLSFFSVHCALCKKNENKWRWQDLDLVYQIIELFVNALLISSCYRFQTVAVNGTVFFYDRVSCKTKIRDFIDAFFFSFIKFQRIAVSGCKSTCQNPICFVFGHLKCGFSIFIPIFSCWSIQKLRSILLDQASFFGSLHFYNFFCRSCFVLIDEMKMNKWIHSSN